MIPVNEPILSKESKQNIREAVESGWISSAGAYIGRFEKEFSTYVGAAHGVAVSNGTTALHLGIAALGIGKGDEVIIPDLTIMSCAFAPMYTGAIPVPVDVDPVTGTIDPKKIEQAITKKTRAIMVVHLYGHPADMDPIVKLARKYRIKVIEDAAEAHGATYKGKKVGALGDVGCFSFYANKIVTCGEGGMVVTNDERLATKLRLLRDLAHSPKRRFLHEEIGFNYRLTNMQAALGVGELSHIDEYIDKKRWMAREYRKRLEHIPFLVLPAEMPWAASVYWMYAMTVTDDSPIDRDTLRELLKQEGVDTRDYFYPIHAQPVLKKLVNTRNKHFPVSDRLSQRGFYVPSGLALTGGQIEKVTHAIQKIFAKVKRDA